MPSPGITAMFSVRLMQRALSQVLASRRPLPRPSEVIAMATNEVRIPGPDHPITIEPHGGRVVVRAGERVIADTDAALELREASYPPVLYVPLDDVDGTTLVRSETT